MDESDGDDDVVRLMRKHGIPITRENYLHIAFMGEIPDPWTDEHEADLPAAIRNLPPTEFNGLREGGPMARERSSPEDIYDVIMAYVGDLAEVAFEHGPPSDATIDEIDRLTQAIGENLCDALFPDTASPRRATADRPAE